jgi:hypothetical protein
LVIRYSLFFSVISTIVLLSISVLRASTLVAMERQRAITNAL